MYVAQPFHPWIPKWMTIVIAVFFLMAQNMVSGVSSYSIVEVTSSLGQEAELIKIAFYASSIGLVVMLPLYYRVRQFFQRRIMLLIFLSLEMILCFIGPSFKEGWEFVLISFIMGAVKTVCLIDMIGLLMFQLNPKNSRGLFYGMYYPISFSSGQLVGYLAAYMVVNYEWAFTYYIAIPGLAISLGIVLICMHSQRSQRKVPLYRFDWIGLVLFAIFAFAFTTVCVYGERLEWFNSGQILAGTLIALGSLLLFVVRQLTVKRPYLDLSTLIRFPQITIGITLMLIMYLGYNSSSIMSSYMETVLKYDHVYVAETSIYMIISFITVIPFVGWMLSKHYPVRIFLFTGFMLFALYHFICSRLFYAEQEISYLILTQILKGAAYGFCITSLSYFASQHVLREFNGHRAFFSVATRYVIATPLTAAIFGHWIAAAKQLHYTSLSAAFTDLNTTKLNNIQMLSSPSESQAGISMSTISSRLNTQAFLLGSIDIYTIVAFICLFIAVAILFIKYLDIHYTRSYKSYPLLDV